MQIGECYMVRPAFAVTVQNFIPKPIKGKVVYVHPKSRYATLEFEGTRHGKPRESFHASELRHPLPKKKGGR